LTDQIQAFSAADRLPRGGHWDKDGKMASQGRLNVFVCFWIVYKFKILISLAAKDVNDQFKLVETLCTRKDRFPAKKLSKNATNRPHINGCPIVVTAEEELWGPVPASYNVFSHELALNIASTC